MGVSGLILAPPGQVLVVAWRGVCGLGDGRWLVEGKGCDVEGRLP